MKKFKSVYRYTLIGLLLAAFGALGVYAHLVVRQLEKTIRDVQFIDLALTYPKQADALLLRLDQFKQFRLVGLVAVCALLVLLAVMITCQVICKRWEKQGRNPMKEWKARQQEKKAAKPAKPAKTAGGFCPNCGTPYEKAEGFCGECGASLKE